LRGVQVINLVEYGGGRDSEFFGEEEGDDIGAAVAEQASEMFAEQSAEDVPF